MKPSKNKYGGSLEQDENCERWEERDFEKRKARRETKRMFFLLSIFSLQKLFLSAFTTCLSWLNLSSFHSLYIKYNFSSVFELIDLDYLEHAGLVQRFEINIPCHYKMEFNTMENAHITYRSHIVTEDKGIHVQKITLGMK